MIRQTYLSHALKKAPVFQEQASAGASSNGNESVPEPADIYRRTLEPEKGVKESGGAAGGPSE